MEMRELFDKLLSREKGRGQVTPEVLHLCAENLWAALYAYNTHASREGRPLLPDGDLLCRLMNLVERLLENNKRGRKGFESNDPEWSKATEHEIFNSVKHGLGRHLGWELRLPMTPEEREEKEALLRYREELKQRSRERYGKVVSEEPLTGHLPSESEKRWLKENGLSWEP